MNEFEKKIIPKKTLVWKIVSIILCMGLVIVSIFYINTLYENKMQTKYTEGFDEGIQIGYDETMFNILNIAVQCQPIKIQTEQGELNLIAMECLQETQG